jgi:class 3 adenylate cyclase
VSITIDDVRHRQGRTIGEIAMERKLTTILAADVVGYSALMEADEAGTHERTLTV